MTWTRRLLGLVALILALGGCQSASPTTMPLPSATPTPTDAPIATPTAPPSPSPTHLPSRTPTAAPTATPLPTSTPPVKETDAATSGCAWQTMPRPDAVPDGAYPSVTDWLQDEAGRLWLATSRGVFVAEQPDNPRPGPDWVRASQQRVPELSGSYVLDLALGPDGSLWAGTLSSGAPYYFEGAAWQTISGEPDQPQERAVGALTLGPDGSLWLGYGVVDGRATETAVARRAPDGSWTGYSPAQVLSPEKTHAFAQAMAFDAQGHLWLAGEGVSTFDGQEWTWFPISDWVFDLLIVPNGDGESQVWIADRQGVRVYQGDHWRQLQAPPALDRPGASSLAADSLGRVWAAYGPVIARYNPDGGLERVFTSANGLPPALDDADNFTSVWVDRADGVWVANRYLTNVGRCVPAGPIALEPLPTLTPQPPASPIPWPDQPEIVAAVLGTGPTEGKYWAAHVTPGSFSAPGADERLAMVGGVGENDEVRWVVIGQTEAGWELLGGSPWFASGFSGPPPSFLPPELFDFDGDGRQEVLSPYFNMRAGWMTGSDALYRWDGQGLARVWSQLTLNDTRMADDLLTPYRENLQVEWQFTDLDSDGLDDILIHDSLAFYQANESGWVPAEAPPTHQQNQQRAFRWDGQAFRPYAPDGPTGPFAYSSEGELWLWQNQASQPLGLENVGAFAWSPEGSQLAWWSSSWDAPASLGVYQLEGGVQQSFRPEAAPQELGWSPDGRLAYSTDAGYCALVDPQTGEQTRLSLPTLGSWSPDGGQVVYAWGRSLYLYDLASQQETLLAASFEAAGVALPAWSPRGDWVACKLSNGSYTWLGLLRPNLNGPLPALDLTQSFSGRESPEVAFAWSPDGSHLAALATDPRFEQHPTVLYLGQVPPVGADPVGQPAWQEVLRLETISQTVQLAWSPDGEGVAAALGNDVWLVDASGEARLRHRFDFPQPAWGGLDWAPDGSGFLLLFREFGRRAHLYWFPARDGEPVLLLTAFVDEVRWPQD